jgi:hypothetical protein
MAAGAYYCPNLLADRPYEGKRSRRIAPMRIGGTSGAG